MEREEWSVNPLKGMISLSLASQPTHKLEGMTRRNCEEILQNPKLLDFRYCDGGGGWDTGENFVRFVFTNERHDFASPVEEEAKFA